MRRNYQREAARRILWADRASLFPHLLEHRHCGVFDAVMEMCQTAGWTGESYILAVLFDHEGLLTEVTK